MPEYYEDITPAERLMVRRLRSRLHANPGFGYPFPKTEEESKEIRAATEDILANDSVFAAVGSTQTARERFVNLALFGQHPPEEEALPERWDSDIISGIAYNAPPHEILAHLLSIHMYMDDGSLFLDSLAEISPDIAEKVRQAKPDVFRLLDRITSGRSIQNLMKELHELNLIDILRCAKPEVKARFIENMSKRKAQLIENEIALDGGPSSCMSRSTEMLVIQVIGRLVAQGEIILDDRPDTKASDTAE
jgi:hypothetical protein